MGRYVVGIITMAASMVLIFSESSFSQVVEPRSKCRQSRLHISTLCHWWEEVDVRPLLCFETGLYPSRLARSDIN